MVRDTKIPPDKKRLSLINDRRKPYGENDRSSRKNIPDMPLGQLLEARTNRRPKAGN